jgi:hypothetical protein
MKPIVPAPAAPAATAAPSNPRLPRDGTAEPPLEMPGEEQDVLIAAGRLVRGGFIMPSADFGLLAALKARASATGPVPDTSELLRAGLHALMDSGRAELRRGLDQLAPCAPRRRRGRRSAVA